MTHYVHIAEPARPRPLPRNWRNVSGLDRLDPPALADLGWMPVVEGERPAHDPIHEHLVSDMEITTQTAVRIWRVVRRPDAAIPSVLDLAEQAIARIDAAAGNVISARYPDHTQRNALASALDLLVQIVGGQIGPEALDQATDIRDMWAWIQRQRGAAQAAKGAIAAAVADFSSGSLPADDARRAIAAVGFAEVD